VLRAEAKVTANVAEMGARTGAVVKGNDKVER
jgi:hypothetical protein